jgi:hypothetical protein
MNAAEQSPRIVVLAGDIPERVPVTMNGLKLDADLLLMDDRKGTIAAHRLGIRATGTLGILDRAAERGLVDFAHLVRNACERHAYRCRSHRLMYLPQVRSVALFGSAHRRTLSVFSHRNANNLGIGLFSGAELTHYGVRNHR